MFFIDIILIVIHVIIIINSGALNAYNLENPEDVGVDLRLIIKWMFPKYVV